MKQYLYSLLPRPIRFFLSMLNSKTQTTPFYSDQTHLKAASKYLYNRLIDLYKGHCPIISMDFGSVTTKIAIFVPASVYFDIYYQYQYYVLEHLSYSTEALNGKFVFLRFETNNYYEIISFLYTHNFPYTSYKILNCCGSMTAKIAPLIVYATSYVEYHKFNKHNCYREGLIFNHSLKIKYQFFTVPKPNEDINTEQQKWHGQYKHVRKNVKYPFAFPCIYVDIGNNLTIYQFSIENYYLLGEYPLCGGTFLGIAKLLLGPYKYYDILKETEGGDSLAVDMTVGDIYGGDYQGVNLDKDLLAAFMGKHIQIRNAIQYEHSDSEEYQKEAIYKPQDVLSSVQSMVAVNSAHIAALFAVYLKIKNCIFSGGFLDNKNVLEKISWAYTLYSGMEAIYIYHDVVLGALGAMFGNYREYYYDKQDEVVKLIEIIENGEELSVYVEDNGE